MRNCLGAVRNCPNPPAVLLVDPKPSQVPDPGIPLCLACYRIIFGKEYVDAQK